MLSVSPYGHIILCWSLRKLVQIIILIRIVGGGGVVHLGSLGTSATEWPIVPTPGYYDDGEFGGMKIVQGKPNYSEKTYPSATLCTTNPSLPDSG
jgi:hypothetical protein